MGRIYIKSFRSGTRWMVLHRTGNLVAILGVYINESAAIRQRAKFGFHR